MKTYFYKILNKNKDVVYVGVTTRTINKRFKEHLISKGLNALECSVVEFDCIEHSKIDSLEIFYKERQKVVEAEQRYIKEELKKGSNLLNISAGGEWGCNILNKLRKEEFFKEFGSYNNYFLFKLQKDKIQRWFRNWVWHRSENKVIRWFNHWVCSNNNKTRSWVHQRIRHRSDNKVKVWLNTWILHRNNNKTRPWLHQWIRRMSDNKVKVWIYNWITHRSDNKVKVWLRSWSYNKNKTKTWLRSWVSHRNKNNIKLWFQHWISHRSTSRIKVWLRSWVSHRQDKLLDK